ncbi:ABC transporter [Kiloniella spongiae]|uniref:ABC transporter n=1 Tax=Kiloniella spongiae TaxID=1489064 RepID=A0A0H2MHK7_9PROT|nr:ATP-binding cassette domain-containing protein [Kiloniella spongiae]KLN60222.1 ABC transporter [Kiloniella spongiae]
MNNKTDTIDPNTTGKDIRIKIRGLTKAFGPKVILNNLDLDVYAGESLVVIGGSGTGKSVLLKCMLGLLRPDAGSIEINEQEIVGLGSDDMEQVRRKFGMLFQYAALFDSLSILDNVAFGLTQAHGVPKKEAHQIALEKLSAVGLGERFAAKFPAELSSGMKKRVGLARAIATTPETLFFDEPTTGLDPVMGDVIDQLIVKSVKELGATGLTITHDMDSAKRISDRIAMLYDGKITWVGPTDELEKTDNPYVHQFINGLLDGPIKISFTNSDRAAG